MVKMQILNLFFQIKAIIINKYLCTFFKTNIISADFTIHHFRINENNFFYKWLHISTHTHITQGFKNCCGTLVGWILNDNQYKVLIRSDHNFVFLRSNTEECQIVARIQITYNTSCFVRQLTHESGILNRCRIVQCAFNRNAQNREKITY